MAGRKGALDSVPARTRVPQALVILGIAALLVVGLTLGLGRARGDVPSVLVGQPPPPFRLLDIDGREVSLDAYRGRPVIVNFWASWCEPCRREAPLLSRAAADQGGDGVAVLGVVFEDEADAVRQFLATYDVGYPALMDPGGRTALDFGVYGLPETFFVDRTGRVVGRLVGELDAASLERALAEVR